VDSVDAIEELTFAALGVTSRSLDEGARSTRLTLTQWRLIALLERAGRDVRLGALADAAGISMPSASRLVARLSARGLVDTRRDPGDARAVHITLSATGRSTAAAVIRRRRALVAEALATTTLSARFAHEVLAAAALLISASRSSIE
jgi:DNA-binding MarR family transcriptional regulator